MMRKRFEEIVSAWLKEKKDFVKLSTYCAYKAIAETHLIPYFSRTKNLTGDQIQSFILGKKQEGLSRNSVRNRVTVLKRILRYAKKCHLIDIDFPDLLFPFQEEKKKRKVRSKKEEKRLLDYLMNHNSLKNLGILICLLTGLRIGEICGLKWEDISLSCDSILITRTVERIYLNEENRKNVVTMSRPKTRTSRREVPICKNLKEVLSKSTLIRTPQCYVLTNDEKPMEPRTYRVYFRKVMNELGLSSIRFHDLRHAFATRCIESKADYKTLSSILGHSSITTTLNLYVHPNHDEKKKCIEKRRKRMESI